jgi:hypothetical protein
MDILGDRFVIAIRGDLCFDVVDCAGGDRFNKKVVRLIVRVWVSQ